MMQLKLLDEKEELPTVPSKKTDFTISKNKFLLPHLMKNDIHEVSNDRAKSLQINIIYNK
jgi:hypothetical protein